MQKINLFEIESLLYSSKFIESLKTDFLHRYAIFFFFWGGGGGYQPSASSDKAKKIFNIACASLEKQYVTKSFSMYIFKGNIH